MKRQVMYLIIGLIFILIGWGRTEAETVYTFVREGVVNGVDYATGGIGIEERAEMNQMAKRYNLKLSFAELSGEYLSGVMVTIKNNDNKTLIDKESQGPWFLFQLPEGDYKIIVSHNHQAKTEMMKVDQQVQTLLFHWKN